MIRRNRGDDTAPEARYPGVPMAMDGSSAVVEMETAASEGAGAYPITPSTQMGEGWAAAKAAGSTNVNGRRLLFFEPEGEHAAAGVTAGMSMTGLRATNFSSGQGIAYMHESLYAAVGKRLTYVLNIAARAMTKHALNVHAGHDDYHAVDDTGFFQLFGKDVQAIADLTLIAHRIAELSLNPGLVAQDGFLTSHVIESLLLPERDLIKEYLGDPADMIESPTPAQVLTFGEKRRRIPEMFDLDYPALLGSVQNQDSYMQGVAAQRPFYFDHVRELADRAMAEYRELTGRRYDRAMGYRMDDADYVLVGQGSVVSNAEVVADYLRAERGLKIGVMDVVMFRPFPADRISGMLKGKKGVTVLERCDQPLAVDQPLLREIRAAMSQGQENDRAARSAKDGARPFPGVADVAAEQVPDFYSAGFGFGSRDLQPADLVLAVENMLPKGRKRRQYYLGIDFVREGTKLPKLEIWQEKLLEHYPDLAERALVPETQINLLPKDAISLRIHSVGGWGAITMGKNVVMTAFELAGLNVKANPKYGSEKKGQPTTFYGVLSREPLRLNGELKFVNVVLSPDPNVFRNSNPLAGMQEGGVFVIQSDHEPEEVWASLPPQARRTIQEKDIKVYTLDAFKIATEEATDPDLRYRMQGTAFMGAFFRTSPFMKTEGLDEETLFQGMRKQLQKKFGHLGERVVEANLKVIRRGFDEVRQVEAEGELVGAGQVMAEAAVGQIPTLLDHADQDWGIGNQGRFWEQVCSLCGLDQDVIADPFAAISAIPAATSTVRDMSDIRFEIPEFIAARCTGCAQCWTQCPDAAIPGLVNSVEDVIQTAIRTAQNGKPLDRIQSISANLAREAHKVLKAVPYRTFGDTITTAYGNLVEKLPWDADRKKSLDEEFAAVYSVLADFPLAKTVPFFDVHENKEKGAGGLLSITVNPEACKGCNICVDVCADGALVTVRQDEENLDQLRRNWKMWENLPDTADRFINIRNLEEGIGVLPSLLLKKENYRTMAGGDGACMGCGEKTAVHLIVSAVESLMQPRVENFISDLEELIGTLDAKARALLSADADLDLAALADGGAAEVPLDDDRRAQLKLYADAIAALKDLLWRYTKGPSGQGRANMGISNSTGCSSVWGSTFPYNPYPYPWVNHLFQDSPSVAIGIFEGHMRKMQDAFAAVRRARLLASGEYDAAVHEPEFVALTWHDFTDEEFDMCAPIVAIGGDGAMMDIGFQNLSRLLASGKPIRVVVLDTQVYSNTGGQACTSGFIGQVSDMAAYGKAQHGKEETRKELALIALAHRGAFVLQSSQASASHMIGGVIRALKSPRPAVMNIYTPCPVEHGLADEWAPNAARFALEGRAFPFLIFDPDAGATIADCMDLSGNPEVDQIWPTYELEYVGEDGQTQKMELPVTTADWAATEGRFKKHFKRIKPADWDDDQVPFHEFLDLSEEERVGKTPFIWVIDSEKKLGRLACSIEMVLLAEDRLLYWSQLKELAGLEVPASVRADISDEMEAEFEAKTALLRAEYDARLAELRMSYPALVARRMAEGLLASGDGNLTVAEILARANADPGLQPITAEAVAGLAGPPGGSGNGGAAVGVAPAVTPAQAVAVADVTEIAPAPAAPAPAEAGDEDEDLVMEPYIETARCTSCDECININKKMFAYDENKQAYIKDAKAGTFAEIVQAAEKCTAGIIHPGTPLNKKEKDLEKW
ncbi:MAG: 2-oxoacid:acceptor oxidoreductase family protein, partial [Candidatus Palauibacterales bacterium]|nr:2-oxoacid:acceptor oxidoreductase family protein [Candidatus Palauibacterales bacterium]